jgi:UDP-glucose 4-epimerase
LFKLNSKILITGGAGYIGSHVALTLLQAGLRILVLDNLCNSSLESIRRVAQITGRELEFVQGDVRDSNLLSHLFADHSVSAVLHLAGLKAVGESISEPLRYYENNVHGSQVLFQAMAEANIFNLIFSSSATVYGEPVNMPISEACPVGRPINPYGRSKLIVEDMLQDLAVSDPRWRIAILRYFNPVGAHESGFIGEDPNGAPNNLLPYIAQVAVGKLPKLTIFGNDYPTLDGTGIRDYIHVVDLAEGHLCALRALQTRTGVNVWNLGTGQGYSVLEIIHAFENASGCKVPYEIAQRRLGDVAICYADSIKAKHDLNWEATRGLSEMMRDLWNWQQINPNGFR